jgi:hypothetical protein
LAAVGLGIWNWLYRKAVVITEATQNDVVRWPVLRDGKGRSILVATGTYTQGTLLSVTLWLIRSGSIAENSTHVREPTCRLCFEERDVSGGRVTIITNAAEKAEVSPGLQLLTAITHDIKIVAKQTLPGTITPGRPHIVYAEGDQAIVVDGSMSVEEFAKANPGNYLVVTVEVR